ncbi:hypothetical protein [Rhizobium leguminosarum]|uniref:hypothetical protein n=1 Tax=Rhizobium leguminosarum TaxID=384 RepID=UPI00103A2128|nr:hypothetical protein [Rhizobium leguminosarum]TBY27441.1 hypothetical protein E0H55_27515 [Rhizobium leguminosarum bv. viciae]
MTYLGKEKLPLPNPVTSALRTVTSPISGRARTKDALGVLGSFAAENLSDLDAGPAVVIGTALDFDDFCTPILRALKSKQAPEPVTCHCVWPTFVSGPDGRPEAIFTKEYRQKAARNSQILICTAVATERGLVDALVDRAKDLHASSSITLISAIMSVEVAELFQQSPSAGRALVYLPAAGRGYAENTYGVLNRALSNDRTSFDYVPKAILEKTMKQASTFGI